MALGYALGAPVCALTDSTGRLVGLLGPDGKEYLINAQVNTAAQAAPTTCYLPAGVAITGGSIAGVTGSFTTLRATSLQVAFTDSSGTPGNVTNNAARGRAAFAAAGTSVVVTSSLVAANSTVLVTLGGTDATLTTIRVTPGAGSFTVTGNAAATATTPFDFIVVQN